MKHIRKHLLVGVALLFTTALSGAEGHAINCGVEKGRVSIVGNEFPAIQTIAENAAQCAGLDVKSNLTADHQKINLAGMQGNPAEYTSAVIANSSIIALMNEDVIRPLDDLIAKYGQHIPKRQLIAVNGKVMAVAFMANAQTLAYRADVLEKVGLDVPKSYEEMLIAAEKIRAEGIMQNPVGGAYAAGWNLAEEFVNMYIGEGGEFFKPGTAEVAINNEQGVAALEMMKKLTEYMNPDYLTHDSNLTQAEWEAGNVALMSMWGSRMQNIMDAEGSEPQVYENTKVGPPLTVGASGVPASSLWWDGWTVAKNISDEDAEATFAALVSAIRPEILNDKTMDQAVWMIEGYKAAPVSEGVLAAINLGTKPYPMLPYQGLLHTALGDNIADFLQGKEDASQALADIEAAYTAAAREKGFLN
ncbi:extracellular solute-binding protein [Ahrensia kielensis]|uniref:Extracellular solute-binding protein n=1 Tax=Ahrensia kielensis TaxID=76980 RepID=A0ABU9TA55_9HYPH